MSTKSMRAALLEKYGDPFTVEEIPRPIAGPGEVLVRIKASGVNPLDLKIRAGEADHARHSLPAVLGMDLAGVVQAVGVGVDSFRPGDEVYGLAGGVGGIQGSLAEYAALDAELLAPKPANLTMREAAALPLVFITAWEGLVDRAAVMAGQSVLIQGGAGGVGHIAAQIALARGAQVYAVDSAAKAFFLKRIGATPIDREESVDDYVARLTSGQGFDIVYDAVGGPVLDASFKAVSRFGHVVSSLGWGTHALAPLSFKAASYSGVFALLPLLTGEGRAHHGDILGEATRMVETGKVIPNVDPRRFGLDAVGDAHDALASRTALGKIVVDIVSNERL